MKYVIIVEPDESKWDDETGVRYNFPKNYKGKLQPGTKFIYYKGKLQNEQYRNKRESVDPYYFGVGVVGEIYPNENKKNEYYSDLLAYEEFESSVPAKIDGEFLEEIPESQETDFWRNSVRWISEERFNLILGKADMDYSEEFNLNQYSVSAKKFDEVYEQYLEFVKIESGGQEFLGFNEGFMYKREAYKSDIREQALKILDTETFTSELIGSGEIAKRVVTTLELKGNNLVDTALRYGPDTLPHRKILDAIETGDLLTELETIFFDLFKSNDSPENCFNQLIALVGKKYAMIAYLFFLKNDREYLPISTTNFEFAFKELDCSLKLSKKCSWENYFSYLTVIRQVKDYIEAKLDENINFIDAHSFLWLIGYQDRFRKWLDEKDQPEIERVFEVIGVTPVNNSNHQYRTRSTSSDKNSNADWEKIEKKKRLKGRKAEELVMEYERKRLTKEGRSDLAEKVEDYSKKYGKGFDVLSWNTNNTERCIEVKASSNNGFIITRNELNKSEENPNFWIYILNEKKNGKVQIKTLQGPGFRDSSQFRLEPKDYYVSFSIEAS